MKINITFLSLTLFVFCDVTNDSKHPTPTDYLTLIANWLNACANFHNIPKYLRNLTLYLYKTLLFGTVDDSPSSKIVGGNFKLYRISRQNADKVHTHLTADMSQYLMPVFQLNFEHCVGERLHNGSLTLDDIFFCHYVSAFSTGFFPDPEVTSNLIWQ